MSRSQRHPVSVFMLSLVLTASLFTIAPAPVVRALEPCGDVQVIFARGSGRGVDADDFQAFFTNGILPRVNRSNVVISSRQLGKDGGYGGFSYPAAGDIATLAQSVIPFLPGSAYDNSVTQGWSELAAYLTDRAAACPNEVYVLGGWSQGAQVIGEGLFHLSSAVRDRIAYTGLFGDPKLDTGNARGPFGEINFPTSCTPVTSSPPWKRWADCALPGGYLTARSPYVPDDMRLRVGSWCEATHPFGILAGWGDGVCDGYTSDLVLTTFGLAGQPHYHADYLLPARGMAQAAVEAATALQVFLPSHAASFDTTRFALVGGPAGADLAIVFDTTGSMSGAIANAKSQATAVAQQWLEFFPGGRVALIDFKDQGDPYVARVDLDLTSNIGDFQAAVNQLSAAGGGDTPEAQLSGIMTALDGLDWQAGATKAEIVITDAPGKDPEPVTGYTRDQVAQHAREIDPVAIYGVNVGSSQAATDFFGPLTDGTAGQVLVVQPGQTLADALFAVLDIVHLSPVATLNDAYLVETGTAVHFSAEGSFDPDGDLVSYEWDFDNDGVVDATTTDRFVDHLYSGSFDGIAAVRVISSDGGSALATATVRVMSDAALAALLPVAPSSAAASVTGADEVTVTWVPAASDRADAYRVYLADETPLGHAVAGSGNQVVLQGMDLAQPVDLLVVAVNDFGTSQPVQILNVGGSEWTSPTKLNDDTTTTMQVYPDVALSTNGSAVAVWQDYRNTPSIDVYGSRRDPASGAWSANARVNDVATGDQYKPAVAMDANGNAYAIWVDTRNGRNDIYFSKRSAATGAWSANVRVNSATSFNSQDWPAIAVGPGGDAVALWYRVANNKQNIWSARLAAGASTWGPEIRVTSDQALQKQAPAVTFAPDGSAHAVWMQPATGNADIYYSTLASGSSTWTTNTKVSDDPGTAFQSVPDIAVDGTGKVFVAWTDRRATPYQLRVRIKSGGSWQPSTVVAADGGEVPSIAARADGHAYLAWHDGDLLTEYPVVRGSMFDPAAGTWSTPERIDTNDATHGGRNPSVVLDGTRLLVLWDNGLSVPSGDNNNDIYARFRTP